MAVQKLLRFAACEYREVIDAIKLGNVAALSQPNGLVLHWHAIDSARGEVAPLVRPVVALQTICGRSAW